MSIIFYESPFKNLGKYNHQKRVNNLQNTQTFLSIIGIHLYLKFEKKTIKNLFIYSTD